MTLNFVNMHDKHVTSLKGSVQGKNIFDVSVNNYKA